MSLARLNDTLLENPLLILGIFREALFFSRDVHILTEDGYKSLWIESVDENTNRKEAGKSRILLHSFAPLELQTEKEFEFRCVFPDVTAIWKSVIKSEGQETYSIALPSSIRINNLRNSLRISPLTEKLIEVTVLVT